MAALLASYGGTGIMLSLMVCLLAILILVLVLGVETASDALRD